MRPNLSDENAILSLPPDRALHVRTALETAGCRFTHQRAAVFAYLSKVQCHPTAEQVYQVVRRFLPKISLATVYKALEALVKADLATKLTYGAGSARYDCKGEKHYHLCDTLSGEVRDLDIPYDDALLTKLHPDLLEKLSQQGFQVMGYRLEILGQFQAVAHK